MGSNSKHSTQRFIWYTSKFVKNTHIFYTYILNSVLGVSSGDETLHLMLDILHQQQCQTQHVGLKNSEYRTPRFQKIINDLLHVSRCGSLSNKDAK